MSHHPERRSVSPGHSPRNLSRDMGFTLLEILVALVVLGIAFVSIFQLFSADIRAVNASDDYSTAVMKAEARMREILDNENLAEQSWSETTDEGYVINAVVSTVAQERTEALPVQLLEVSLRLTWTRDGKERTFTLKTMKTVSRKV